MPAPAHDAVAGLAAAALSGVHNDTVSTYTMSSGRHLFAGKDRAFTMSAIAPLLDQLCDGDVVDTSDLAFVSDSTPRSVARWRTEETAPQREAENRILELRSVVDLACRVIQRDAVRLWLRAPNSELGYEKPLELIAKGEYKRVVGLLLALAEGVTT